MRNVSRTGSCIQKIVRPYLRNRIAQVFAVCGLLCASVAWPQSTPGPASTKPDPSIGRKRSLKGVPNFGEVTDKLYRGGKPSAEGVAGLAHESVGLVINLSGENNVERDRVTKAGMEYVAIPWHCFHAQNEQVAKFLRVLRAHPDKKIFVHCRLGDDRTGMMIASYRMAEQGWTAQQAMKEMVAFGFSEVHHWICPGLASYEQNFPREFQTSPAFEGLRPQPPASQTRPQ